MQMLPCCDGETWERRLSSCLAVLCLSLRHAPSSTRHTTCSSPLSTSVSAYAPKSDVWQHSPIISPTVRHTGASSWGATAAPGAAWGLLVRWYCNPRRALAHHSHTLLVQAQQQLERSQAQARQRQASEAQREVSSHPSTRQDPSAE